MRCENIVKSNRGKLFAVFLLHNNFSRAFAGKEKLHNFAKSAESENAISNEFNL